MPFKYTEQELITHLKENEQSAFAYLYDHYSGALYGIIYKIIKDREIAENVLQETFVKAWNHIENYDSAKGRIFTWIVNIAKHQAIDTLRSKSYKIHANTLSTDYLDDSIKNNADTFAKFDSIGIMKHVSCLKNDQKQIINLAYFEGYTQEEISKYLVIPLGTVKTKLRMAIKELRKSLN